MVTACSDYRGGGDDGGVLGLLLRAKTKTGPWMVHSNLIDNKFISCKNDFF